MATGLRDTGLGKPVMDEPPTLIRGCPESMELPHAGHFVQEAGEEVAITALESFGILQPENSCRRMVSSFTRYTKTRSLLVRFGHIRAA